MHPDTLLELPINIAIVAHDAGGAELISSLIRLRGLSEKCSYSLSGPANKIFNAKLGGIKNFPLEDIILQCDYLLCGSSWESEHELNAIKLAKFYKKKSIVYLDHWVNYESRFTRNNALTLPNEIWVPDRHAKKIAKSTYGICDVSIKEVENPYLIEVRNDFIVAQNEHLNTLYEPGVLRVLFLSEAISEHAKKAYGDERYWGYTEKDALNFFLNNRNCISSSLIRLRVRPHPADAEEKYSTEMSTRDISFEISDKGQTLIDDIVWSDIIVGCSSMAMVVALISKKRVICAIPPKNRGYHLPHDGIESLVAIVAGKNNL
jgi:hypothetical protein